MASHFETTLFKGQLVKPQFSRYSLSKHPILKKINVLAKLRMVDCHGYLK